MRRAQTEAINIAIMQNETTVSDWMLSDLACELYWWADFFNIVFFAHQPVPIPVISFERTRINTLGHYVIGRNSFGVRENINLNRAHLGRPHYELLATLVHEMAHSWQHCYGTPSRTWYHNKEFQAKMLDIGIRVADKGYHTGVGDPFVFLLRKHAVPFGQLVKKAGPSLIVLPPRKPPKGTSKLKLWECSCGQKARVGKSEFHATCTLCGDPFELKD